MLLSSDPSPWLAVFGRFHPVLLHLPIGLVPGLFVLEFGAFVLRREPPRGALFALSLLAALGAAAAAASGLVLGGEQDSGELVSRHKTFGLVFGGLCLLLPLVAFWRDRRAFRVVAIAALAASIPAGHLGGELTHGRGFLFAPLAGKAGARATTTADRGTGDPAVDPTAEPGGGTGRVIAPPPPAAATDSVFARDVAPILERTCVKCHNPDKHKADLLLTTLDGLRKGSENGKVVVPGKPDESELLLRCLLPLDDEDHMPPEGKPQPTEQELAALRAWIAAGAPD